MFLRCLVPWPSTNICQKFCGDRPRGTPPSGELNERGVAKYSDFGPIEGYISEMVQDRGKLVLMTNRKSYMTFNWYQNRGPWMTLKGVIALIFRYFTEFGSLATRWHSRKILRRSSQGNPSVVGVKHKRGTVAKYSDFGPIEGCISETVQDRR